MHVKIAGHDQPVRAPGALPSPIGLLPASENAKWVGMLVSFALGLILSTAHIAGSPAPFGLAFLAAMGYGSGGALCLVGCALGYFAAFGVATGTQLAAGSSADLAAQIPGAKFYPTFAEIEAELRRIARPGDIILTVGAGDVFRIGEHLLHPADNKD